MKRAAEKLNSRRGASILLALVFVLTCVMVGISVLSAAASNAGRTHSNHEEQQLYLSLSSALQLVADDLARTKYTPHVSDFCTVSKRQEPTDDTDEDGNPIMRTITTYTHFFSEADGSVNGGRLGDLFQKSLDMVFNTAMSKINFSSYDYKAGNEEFYYSGSFPSVLPALFTLTVTPDPEKMPIGADKDTYHAARKVAVDVEIDDSYSITLTARLAEDDADADSYSKNFRLSAELARSSASLPYIDIPTYGSDGETFIAASPAVEWKQGVIKSAYADPDGGTAP